MTLPRWLCETSDAADRYLAAAGAAADSAAVDAWLWAIERLHGHATHPVG